MYDTDIVQTGAKINCHLLETSRICAVNENESNFHIFYALLLGATSEFVKKLFLDPLISYKVSTFTY